MKLYPPYIEGTIPAFYKNSKGTVTLTVPFSMNRSVSKSEVAGFELKVKSISQNKLLFTLNATDILSYDIENDYEVSFNLTNKLSQLDVGQYYKIQLAYISTDGTVGYYSTVGVTKYTTQPSVTISKLTQHVSNNHLYEYTGVYMQYSLDEDNVNQKDITEKVYSYRFKVYDKEGNIIDDSGEIIHNNENNVETYESHDTYKFSADIPANQGYYIQYTVYTNNQLTVSSPKYKIVQRQSIPPEIEATMTAEMNFDNGYIDVKLVGKQTSDGLEKPATGAFLITRASSEDNFETWNEVFRFTLHGQEPSRQLLRDFTIEQGKEYMYSLQQYNDYGLYSSRLYSNVIMADFEDIFLYDGTRQLKIKYNPKVSSFKLDKLETKTDTIGSKYPFIFRNGKVGYKEFPISGLLSYWSDDANFFITDEELGLTEGYADVQRPGTMKDDIKSTDNEYFWNYVNPDITATELKELYQKKEAVEDLMQTAKPRTVALVDYNVAAERIFKMTVLEWLNNGKVKLFRSPSEGNYLVRLMNISMTPEDRTGRLVHTFTATAYEIAECNYDNMVAEDIISIDAPNLTQLRWETVPVVVDSDPKDERYTKYGSLWYLSGSTETSNLGNILVDHNPAVSVRFTDFIPGSIVYVRTVGEDEIPIVIGATGSYEVNLGLDIDIIRIPTFSANNIASAYTQGLITYSYLNDAQNVFNTVQDVNIVDCLGQQFIGSHDEILDEINNIKDTLLLFYYLRFEKRDVETALTASPNGNQLPLFITEKDELSNISYNGYSTNKVIGIESVDKNIVKRDLVINSDSQTTPTIAHKYYRFENKVLQCAGGKEYDDTYDYFIKSPLYVYNDIINNKTNIVNQDSYDRIKLYLSYVQSDYDYDDIVLSNLELYSNKISIDGHVLDLTETEKFEINQPIVFDSIQLDNGVILECGYRIQRVTYSVEDTSGVIYNDPDYKTQYTTAMTALSADTFQTLLDNLRNLSSDSSYTTAAAALDSAYSTNVINARKALLDDGVYANYLTLVEEQKAIYEEELHYE